ncbi:MAG: hypothetical protein ACTSPM_01935 [Candidatus Heimdallarchaeota archaeon]
MHDEAISSLEKSIALDNDSEDSWYTLALVY